MKAAVCREFGKDLAIEEVSLAPPGPKQVAVDVGACAICHSDIFYVDGAWGGHLPAVYGHEAAGVVSSVGNQVTDYAPGDHVLVTLIKSCGTCPTCSSGHPVNCEEGYDRVASSPITLADGEVAEHGLQTGAFAEAVVVDQSQVVKIPEDIQKDVARLLACGVITGLGAVTNTAGVRAGESVVVVGAGGVGLNAIQGAKLCGAATIIALDLEDEKLQGAVEFGATHAIKATDKDVIKQVRKATGGRGADYVFVTVGAIQAFEAAPRFLATRGEMIMVGMPPSGAKASYEPVMLTALSQSMKGSLMGETVLKRDIPWLIEQYRQGRLKLDELITNRYSLDQINEAIADTKAGKSRRNVIVF
ncbi:MAG: Zn-dependent alcohol dehydrogenase [Rhodobacteraceae bacterium]|nr:Zn-dependent alcohol dehydrogenase [Paracoccaceae bacterium]